MLPGIGNMSDSRLELVGKPDPKFPIVSLGICLICAALLVTLYFAPLRAELLKIEHWTADWRSALLSDRSTREHPRIAIVVLNKDTAAGYPSYLPLPHELNAKVLRAVDAAGPGAIGHDPQPPGQRGIAVQGPAQVPLEHEPAGGGDGEDLALAPGGQFPAGQYRATRDRR